MCLLGVCSVPSVCLLAVVRLCVHSTSKESVCSVQCACVLCSECLLERYLFVLGVCVCVYLCCLDELVDEMDSMLTPVWLAHHLGDALWADAIIWSWE